MATVWHSGHTIEDAQDLQRFQKTALKISLQEMYISYEKALNVLNLESLLERREFLYVEFAKKCLKSDKMKQFCTVNSKIHPMMTRNQEKYDIDFAKTGRLQDSPIIYMQRLLNGL